MASSSIGFGRANPFPLTFGGGTSTVDVVHQSLLDAYAPGWDVSDGTEKAADAYAQALAATMIWIAGRRLANQAQPLLMLENLTTWETVCKLRPSPTDTAYARRSALAAKLRGVAGNTLSDISDACAALLGSSFVGVFPVQPSDEITYWPGINPGVPGLEWTSNRCRLRVVLSKEGLSDVAFATLTNALESLLTDMLPTWMDYSWDTGSPFIIEQSLLDEASI
jgi:hypothetical protein